MSILGCPSYASFSNSCAVKYRKLLLHYLIFPYMNTNLLKPNSCFRYLTAYEFINVAVIKNSFVVFMGHFCKKLNMGCFGLFGGQVRKFPQNHLIF